MKTRVKLFRWPAALTLALGTLLLAASCLHDTPVTPDDGGATSAGQTTFIVSLPGSISPTNPTPQKDPATRAIDELNDVVYNGSYMLATDRSAVTVGAVANFTAPLRVYTDFSGGWEVAGITYASGDGWLTVTPPHNALRHIGLHKNKKSITFTAESKR